MINMIYSDDPSHAFDTILFPNQDSANQTYIQQQLSSFSNTLTEVGRNWMQGVTNIYNDINSSAAAHVARSALKAATGIFFNRIVAINDINDMRFAAPIMQRWVMANPVIRQTYHRQLCSGYVDSYVDIDPGLVGEKHYDYRRVMDSVVTVDPVDGDMVINYYPDQLRSGDVDLEHREKVAILSTWQLAELFMQQTQQDPTATDSSML